MKSMIENQLRMIKGGMIDTLNVLGECIKSKYNIEGYAIDYDVFDYGVNVGFQKKDGDGCKNYKLLFDEIREN